MQTQYRYSLTKHNPNVEMWPTPDHFNFIDLLYKVVWVFRNNSNLQ